MFRLEESVYLFALVLVPILWGISFYAKKTLIRRWSQLGNINVLQKSVYLPGQRNRSSVVVFGFVMSLLVIALCNPQWGQKKEKIRSQNVDIFIALDVSKSMMATDIQPNRLSRAQIWIKQFTERFPSERIGLISFAGNAYLQSPLTSDMATIQLLSSAMKPSSVGMQGTSIAAAIQMAVKSFPQKEGFHKVIIILSDGEDHEGESVEAAKSAHEAGVTIFTVPVGTSQGGALPNLDQPGEGYRRDEKGNVIISIPNRDLLDQVASAAQGERIELQDGENGFDKMKKRFSSLAKKEITYQSFSEYQSYFQFPLFLAMIIWLGDVLINRRKK